MKMEQDSQKQALRNLMQIDVEPSMRTDFQEEMTQVWLEKSRNNDVVNDRTEGGHVLVLMPPSWRMGLTLLVLISVGFWYWQHLREAEELKQFDVLLEFSMGTL